MAVFSFLSDKDKAELWSCLALKYSLGLGLHSANALIEHYGSAFDAVELGRRAPGCWVSEGLVSERTAKAFARESWREKARQEWETLQSPGRQFLFRTHHRYPSLLAAIHDAPLILYYEGDIQLLANPMIGVVGSRKCSDAGLLACAVLTRQLSSFGVTIVSGLAKGIDRAAHIAGLSSLGSSVAVLGTGIDVVYPESNGDVFGVLQEKGLILSEFPPGTGPHARNFPIRNRIISGLSRGVLIVEAAKRSGSLITARLALEQGRDVFAIPGNSVGKHSEGCHELIRNGAKPVFSAEDIVLDLAPLLNLDVKEQLARLQHSEPPGSIKQFSRALCEETALPTLLEPDRTLSASGYAYGVRKYGDPSSKSATASKAPLDRQILSDVACKDVAPMSGTRSDESISRSSMPAEVFPAPPGHLSAGTISENTAPAPAFGEVSRALPEADPVSSFCGYLSATGFSPDETFEPACLADSMGSQVEPPSALNPSSRPRSRSVGCSENRLTDNPAVHPANRSETYPVASPETHPVTGPEIRPAVHPVAHPVAHPAVHPVAHPEAHPEAHLYSQRAPHPVTRRDLLPTCSITGVGTGLKNHTLSLSSDVSPATAAPVGGLEERLVPLLRDDWRHIDWLSETLDADTASVSTALTMLEVSGVIIQKPGMFYRLADD